MFFEKLHRISNPLATLIRRKERKHEGSVSGKSGAVTADPIHYGKGNGNIVKKMIPIKFNNLGEMDRFLERHTSKSH